MKKCLMFAVFFANLIAFKAFAGSAVPIQLMSIQNGTKSVCSITEPFNFGSCDQCLQIIPSSPGEDTITLTVKVTEGTARRIEAVLPTGWDSPQSFLTVTYSNCTNVPTNGICTITFRQTFSCAPNVCAENCQTVSISADNIVGFSVRMQIGTA